jgi:hypothetical protein
VVRDSAPTKSSRDGRELFYLAGTDAVSRLMVVSVSAGASFSAAPPRLLFEGRYFPPSPGVARNSLRTYDISADGKRFLMIKDLASESTTSTDAPLVMVLNFFDELKRLGPAKR